MKLRFLSLILCFSLLSSCSSQSPNECISNELGISIPEDVDIIYIDTHGGFHGDGTKYTMIEFEDKIAEDISTQIQENDDWNRLPLTENLQLIMYGGTKGTQIYVYNLAKEAGIPMIKQGYWIFIDRFDDKNMINDDEKLFARGSFNFTLAIYDTDKDVLYYLEFDT